MVSGHRMRVIVGALVASTLLASVAHAHGGRPQIYDVLFAADDPDTLVVPATFGTLFSDDGGSTFSIVCLDAMPDPRPGSIRPTTLTRAGTIVVAQEFGVVRARELGCGFAYVESEPRDAFIADVVRYGDDVLVLRSDASTENQVFVTRDDGVSLEALPARFPTDFLPERLRIAPSDPSRWWVSGTARRAGTTFLDGAVYVSRDAGASYERHAFPLELDERRLRVLAIDPEDPDHAIAVVHALGEDRVVELTLEETGLVASRRGVLEADPMNIDRAFAAAFLPDRALWLGNDLGGLHALEADGTLRVIDRHLALACLVVRGEDLYLCADDFPDEAGDGFALARQRIGEPYAPARVFGYEDIVGPRACGHESDARCAVTWPETLVDLGRADPLDDAGVALDAGALAWEDAASSIDAAGPPPTVASGCTCRAGSRSDEADTSPGSAALLVVLIALARRPRRAACPEVRAATCASARYHAPRVGLVVCVDASPPIAGTGNRTS